MVRGSLALFSLSAVMTPIDAFASPPSAEDALEIAGDEEEARRSQKVPLPPRKPALDKHYLGTHWFRVNRVNDDRKAVASVTKDPEKDQLLLEARATRGAYHVHVKGTLHPKSRREFVLVGTIAGRPDTSYKNADPPPSGMSGAFTFRATKSRRFWRMYEVNGVPDVCDDKFNQFCYVDVGFGRPPKAKRR